VVRLGRNVDTLETRDSSVEAIVAMMTGLAVAAMPRRGGAMTDSRPHAHDNVVLGPVGSPRTSRRSTTAGAPRSPPSGGRAAERVQPEDWIGSATTLFGKHDEGSAACPTGGSCATRSSRPRGLARRGAPRDVRRQPGLLVKLLDAGQRLPVHAHPSREWARRHLDCPYGKTEAWVIIECRDDARVHPASSATRAESSQAGSSARTSKP